MAQKNALHARENSPPKNPRSRTHRLPWISLWWMGANLLCPTSPWSSIGATLLSSSPVSFPRRSAQIGAGFGGISIPPLVSGASLFVTYDWVGPDVSLLPCLKATWILVMMKACGDLLTKIRSRWRSGQELNYQVWFSSFSPSLISASPLFRPPRNSGYVRTQSGIRFHMGPVCIYLKNRSNLWSNRTLPLLSVSISHPLLFSTLWFFVFCTGFMANLEKMAFKNVLCSDPPTNEMNENIVSGGAAGEAGVDFSTSVLPTPMTVSHEEKANDPSSSETLKEIDVAGFMSKMASVNLSILKLKEQSLFAYVTGKPMEMSTLIDKLRKDWTFLHGEFHFFPKDNGWVEIRFANPADKRRIWEGRPFHVFSQLLLLRPWKATFDPLRENTTKLDLWIRILHLPAQYMGADVLKTIIEMNKVGEFVKVDAYTARGVNVCYPRLCVCAEKVTITDCKVLVPDEMGKLVPYKVWCEEFSPGCGFCGALEHVFEVCELQILHKKANEKIARKAKGYRYDRQEKGKEQRSEKDGWTKVIRKNKWKHGVSVENAGGAIPEAMTGKAMLEKNFPNDEIRMEAYQTQTLPEVPAVSKEKGKCNQLIDDLEIAGDPENLGELTPQEIELLRWAPIAVKGVAGIVGETSSYNSFLSLTSNSSTVKKLEGLAMIPAPYPSSGSGVKREGEGTMDTATSNLKGSGSKRMRLNE